MEIFWQFDIYFRTFLRMSKFSHTRNKYLNMPLVMMNSVVLGFVFGRIWFERFSFDIEFMFDWRQDNWCNDIFFIVRTELSQLDCCIFQLKILIGWIPRIFGFLNPVNETWIRIAQIVELEKSFPMIPNLNQFPGNWTSEIKFSSFAWVFG